MKKKKDNDKPATVGDVTRIVKKIVTEVVTHSEEKLALIFGAGLKDVEERLTTKITLTENNLRTELGGKIDTVNGKLNGTNARIDDLAMNRVKYEDHVKLVERVDKLERTIGKKKLQ